MTKTPIEALLDQCPSIYKLVVVAARRAKELADGAPKFVETDAKKVTSIALEEILKGKVAVNPQDEAETTDGEPKKKRASRAKAVAEKKKG